MEAFLCKMRLMVCSCTEIPVHELVHGEEHELPGLERRLAHDPHPPVSAANASSGLPRRPTGASTVCHSTVSVLQSVPGICFGSSGSIAFLSPPVQARLPFHMHPAQGSGMWYTTAW